MMLLQAREKYLSLRKSTKTDVAMVLEEVLYSYFLGFKF